MTVKFNTNSTQSILDLAKKSFENDGRLDKKEFLALKKVLEESDLPLNTKKGVLKFLEKTQEASNGVFGKFGETIPNKELASLKKLVSSLGDNKLANNLLESVKSSINNDKKETIETNNYKNHETEPKNEDISKLFSSNKNSKNLKLESNFYVSQGNGLPSHGSDCGPSCATMVLKRFGIFDKSTTGAQGTTKIRNYLNQSDHAISEDQIKSSIEHFSKGKVKEVSRNSFTSANSLISAAKDSLAKGNMPILLTGSPYHDKDPKWKGRHYMIITGIAPNGNIQLADPGGKYKEITPERLQQLMNKTAKNASNPTVLQSFNV
ncbi:MAG: C39 family peptidase [Candidatus Sericytochromatia bacterium]